jgi:hypothetical protein
MKSDNSKRMKPQQGTAPGKPGPFRPAAKRKVTPQPGNGAPANSQERITEAGLIRVANLEAVQSLPLFYCSETGKWYGPSGQGGFSRYKDSHAAALVAEHGFNRRLTDDQGNTPADRVLMWLTQNKSVAYAGPLGGYRAGFYELDCGRILVTESQRLVTPTPGVWPTIQQLIETMFADEKYDQLTVFYLWASESFAAFYYRMTHPGPWPFRHCPAFGIFGPRHCGKTALIELVLAPLLGNRKGDPMTFLKEGRFNKDLFGASLLALDDKGANAGLAERRQRGEAIKDLLWKPEQRMEGKGADALMLRPFWRMVIAGNDDDAGLQVCPALSPSLEDKLILLRARQAAGLPQTKEENDLWADAIRKELSAFAVFLLGFRPPVGVILDPRTRVLNFKHPELVSALREMQPEMKLLELIDGLGLIDVDAPLWEGTASEFEKAMRERDKEGILDRLFINATAAGRMLTELARITPERIKRTSRGGTAFYRIFRKQGLPKDETS